MKWTVMLAMWFGLGCETSEENGSWPKQVTLTSLTLGANSDDLRLADGRLAAGGDIVHVFAVQNSLRATMDLGEVTFCPKGVFASLSDVPADELPCNDTGLIEDHWQSRFFYGDAGDTTLVRNVALTAVYRLRVLDSKITLDSEGALSTASVTFEYAPSP